MLHGGDRYRNQVIMDFSVNTNPFGMPDGVKAALRRAVDLGSQYPDIKAEELTGALAEKLSVAAGKLVMGNGASELIPAVFRALKPKTVLLPVPSFSGYERAAAAENCKILYYELKEAKAFCYDEDFFSYLTEETDLLFLANPNNPTGVWTDSLFMERVCEACLEHNIDVVIDECFLPLSKKEEDSFIRKIDRFPNVLILRAFTKTYAMAGVRLGYLVCREETAWRVKKQLPEWNVSVFAQTAGIAALKETEFLRESVDYVEKERTDFCDALRRDGFTVYDSGANFLFIKSELPLYQELLKQGILIRDCSNFKGLGQGYYRIAVKTKKENEALLAALKQLTGQGKANKDVKRTGAGADREKLKIEYLLPAEIEGRSFAIIAEELEERGISLPQSQEAVTMRVIHTSADFSYADTMTYSECAVEKAKRLILQGADIVTDTNMALSGINKKLLARYGGAAHCFMAEEETARLAKERGITRAAVSMEHASTIQKPVIFAVGNAPTALLALYEMWQKKTYRPAFIIGVPVGFVNVEAAKELILQTDIPYIVNRGRKGGSNVAAAICNAVLYELGDRSNDA